jgi:hypothetical protein
MITGCGDARRTADVPESSQASSARAIGVCPPFPLRDEGGNVIDPVKEINDSAPYSPRQTCGGTDCHDYPKITEGFHFTQGKGEVFPAAFEERYQWASSPGNYGGTWCSLLPTAGLAVTQTKADRAGVPENVTR